MKIKLPPYREPLPFTPMSKESFDQKIEDARNHITPQKREWLNWIKEEPEAALEIARDLMTEEECLLAHSILEIKRRIQ